MQEVFLIKSNK